MPAVKYVLANGHEETIDVAEGANVMEAAVNAGLRGIEGDCGGYCQCATCHVYLDDAWIGQVPPPSADENDMLEGVAAPRLAGSRLGCQIKITPALDGLTVRVPEFQ